MPLTIGLRSNDERPLFKLSATTYANSDKTKVVAEESPEAAWFIGNAGDEIPMAQAVKLGMAKPEKPAGPEPEAKAVDAPPENKAIAAPPATKRRSSRK